MSIDQGPQGQIVLYGRYGSIGWQSWGMFRYDGDAKRWFVVGGDPYLMIERAKSENPDWYLRLHDPIRGKVPTAPTDSRPLVWAWQPAFYNFCRDNWGVRFDRTGRMHVRMNITALNGSGMVVHGGVYAYTDDFVTFHRADGSVVKLPLTLNPASSYLADWDEPGMSQRWKQWIGVLRYCGYPAGWATPPTAGP
jgi:hypothetical protein